MPRFVTSAKAAKPLSDQPKPKRPGSRRLAASVAALALAFSIAACTPAEERVASHYKNGAAYLEKQEFALAAVEFKSALQIDENHAESWFGMAQIEEQKQNWPVVLGDLKRVIELDPKHIKARAAIARIMLLSGNLPEALKQVNAAAETAPDDLDLMAVKATVLLRLNDLNGALEQAGRLLKSKPGSEEALLILAAERRIAKDFDGALQFADQGLKANADSVGLRLFKIEIYEMRGDMASQEAAIREIASKFPEEPAYRKGLVNFYLRAKRTDDAEKVLRETAAAKPDDIQANLDVAGFLAAAKGPDAARVELLRLVEVSKDKSPYQSALAQLLFQQGNLDHAAAMLREVIAREGISEAGLNARVDLAAKLAIAKKFDDAAALVKEVLDNDARNTGGLQVRASISAARGDLESATADLREALNNSPKDVQLKRMLAQVYERAGSIELANKELADANKLSGAAPDVALEYVGFLMRHGNVDRSEDILLEATVQRPNDIDLLKALADVKLRKQDWQGAERVAQAIKEAGGGKGVESIILSASLAGQNKLSESIELLRSAHSLAPEEARPLYELVRTLVASGKPGEAEDLVRASIAASPKNVPALILLASIQFSNKLPEQAEATLNSALAAGPDNPSAYRALADFQGGAGRIDGAIKLLESAAEKFPQNMDILMSLAMWRERAGDFDGAIGEYEKIYAERPDSIVVANNLASLLSDHRSDKESLDRAARYAAVLRDSNVPQFQDTLGWSLLKAGDRKSAIPLLERSAEQLPDLPDASYHLGVAYAEDGRKEDAAKYLKLALSKAKSPALLDKINAALKDHAID
jgi:cellulose synthase operon protein C